MLDWKDALSQLKGDLPQGEDLPSADTPAAEEPKDKKKGKLNIAVEKKGRGGKTATIIYGFTCDDSEIAETAARLKQRLGIGGSARGGEILLQGECRAKAAELLREMGYQTKG